LLIRRRILRDFLVSPMEKALRDAWFPEMTLAEAFMLWRRRGYGVELIATYGVEIYNVMLDTL